MVDEAQSARKRPSIYDVANEAGVSHMTVSRVINGSPHIKEDTRQRVEAAIAATRYRPSSAARSLATRRAMRIGAIVDSPTEYGPTATLLALERAAREMAYAIAAFSRPGASSSDLQSGIADLEQQGVDAICIIGSRGSTKEALRLAKASVPVIIADPDPEADVLTVGIDHAGGATTATEHLLALGHRRIVHLAGPADSIAARVRERACREAAVSGGANLRVIEGDWSSDFGYAVGSNPEMIVDATAVFAANDQMALGLIHGLWHRGIRVPDEISVVGFDDVPGAAHFIPPLTTIRADLGDLGDALVRAATGLLAGQEIQPQVVRTQIVMRGSTGRIAR